MKMTKILFLGLFISSTSSFAGDHGNISCDTSWKICLQSNLTDSANTIHYVGNLNIEGKDASVPFGGDQTIEIQNQSGNVVVKSKSGQTPELLLGKITSEINADEAKSALSRELELATGLETEISTTTGKPVTYCNQTALGFVYERYTYKTNDSILSITKNGKTLVEIKSNALIYPAVSVHTSVFPCKK